jgi:hypothetical protein
MLETNNLLDEDDIRMKLINQYEKVDLSFEIKINNDEFKQNCEKLLSILDKTFDENDYCGLPLYNKTKFLLSNDNYQNLYNLFIDDITEEFQKKNKLIFDYITITDVTNKENELIDINIEDDMAYSYIKKIYHLIISFFGNLKNYHTNNITAYTYDNVPKIAHLIKYLSENNDFKRMNE